MPLPTTPAVIPVPAALRTLPRLALGLLLAAVPAAAQPEIPTQAPPEAPWRVVVAGEDEPGDPLVVSGVVYAADGATPVAGASVFVYQTGADGVYGPEGNRKPRLHAYLRTDREGRWEIRTVRPGSYPGRRIAAHIHVHVAPPGGGEEQVSEIVFEGDPLLTERMRRNPFFGVRPLERGDDGVLRCTYDVSLEGESPGPEPGASAAEGDPRHPVLGSGDQGP